MGAAWCMVGCCAQHPSLHPWSVLWVQVGAGGWAQGAQTQWAPKRALLCTQDGCSMEVWAQAVCSWVCHACKWLKTLFSE